MDEIIKVIAFYLPQYHELEVNNKWWGKGFTEWVNVKRAKPLFDDHYQPRIPLNNNYYNLSDPKIMQWQAETAKKYGVYGFCFYHYWFNGKPLMEEPLLNLLNSDLELQYCFCWANESWTNGWAGNDVSIILEQKYGSKEEWKEHFMFLLPFFRDKRYINENNMPLIVIYRPYLYAHMKEMLEYWKTLAKDNGFAGLKIASQRYEDPQKNKSILNYMDYNIEYQPDFKEKMTPLKSVKSKVHRYILKTFNKDVSLHKRINKAEPNKYDYDKIWQEIINSQPISDRAIAGGFTDWDNTARHGNRGQVLTGVSPEKFGRYMELQIKHIKKDYNNNYMFLFAWNEWGEGGYLEPDVKHGYGFLEELKKALEVCNSRNEE